ncbi:hypothetical protein LUX01_13745 [Streptomyces sudanensis]|uniref:hypothetical protein n=1 Tax=Streptomyces sudanensis TaxID=436397 RepID=UPI0020CE8281|nr:hypothetical protein [Streptomyces sudanensis]MCP9987593.1 hypothetical protein [Streptomyces sudanensis]
MLGTVTGSWLALAAGWLLAYATRRLSRGQAKWGVLGLPGAVAAGAAVWLWGRVDGRWGNRSRRAARPWRRPSARPGRGPCAPRPWRRRRTWSGAPAAADPPSASPRSAFADPSGGPRPPGPCRTGRAPMSHGDAAAAARTGGPYWWRFCPYR